MVTKDQGLTDYGPEAKSSKIPVLVNAFLLELGHIHVLCRFRGFFPAPQAK